MNAPLKTTPENVLKSHEDILKNKPNKKCPTFRERQHKESREKWCAAKYAILSNRPNVLLWSPDKTPDEDDIDIVIENQDSSCEYIQIVEATEEKAYNDIELNPYGSWNDEAALIIQAIRKKANKYKHPEKLTLLIYSNPRSRQFRDIHDVIQLTKIETEIQSSNFRNVYILLEPDSSMEQLVLMQIK